MRRAKGKPLTQVDRDALAKFGAELKILDRVRRNGATHKQAMQIVFGQDLADPETN